MNPFEALYGPSMMMGGNQAQSMARQMQGLHAMSYINRDSRPVVPFARQRAQGRGPLSGQGNGEEDFSQFSYNPEMNQLARAAGVTPLDARQANPNAFLPNSGFFGRHPMISRMLEGAMLGGANTQDAEGWGEGISNSIRGMLTGQQERRSLINRQFAAPFEGAATLEKLRGLGIENQLHEATIQHYRAENEHYNEDIRHNKAMEGIAADKINNRPIPAEGGAWVDDNSPWKFEPGPGGKSIKEGGGGFVGEMVRGVLGPPPKDGTPAAKQYWADAQPIINKYQGGQAYARSFNAGTAAINSGVKDDPDTRLGERFLNWSRPLKRSQKAGYVKTMTGKDISQLSPKEVDQALHDYFNTQLSQPSSPTPTNAPQAGASRLEQQKAMLAAKRNAQRNFSPTPSDGAGPSPALGDLIGAQTPQQSGRPMDSGLSILNWLSGARSF